MSVRNIVKIDEDRCNGCGECISACAEGAIELVNGKAKLVSDVYCDGLGACLGHCPQDAITIEQRESIPFDEVATEKHLTQKKQQDKPKGFQCPGSMVKMFDKADDADSAVTGDVRSQLGQWPIHLKLVSPNAPYFKNADMLLVADCVPFAMGDFHDKFLKGKAIAVGCPKLDDTRYYIDKLAEILKANDLNSLTVVHMEVPCCTGLVLIAQKAIDFSGLQMSFEDVTISLQGQVLKC